MLQFMSRHTHAQMKKNRDVQCALIQSLDLNFDSNDVSSCVFFSSHILFRITTDLFHLTQSTIVPEFFFVKFCASALCEAI